MRPPDPRPAAVTMTAVLLTWLAAWGIEAAEGLHLDVIVLAVVLALSLGRVADRDGPGGLRHHARRTVVRLMLLPVIAVTASEVGHLLVSHRWWGGVVFSLVLAGAVWVRRFGRPWTVLGTLVSLPFIALLVVPVPLSAASAHSWWPALFAVLALLVVSVVRALALLTGVLARDRPVPAASPASTASPAPPPRRPSRRRLPASTRMAVQLLVALLGSYAVGRWLFPQHWPWAVLSCYVVCSGNRGRGDVLHKGVLRLTGALAGTASATLLTGAFAAGDRIAVALIFVVMAVALWLREASYAWWAMGVTAMLALLQGYLGAGGVGELDERLLGVLLGSALAVAVSWWLLPVRSGDVFRKRLGAALRAFRDGDLAGFRVAVDQVRQLAPAHRLHLRALRLAGRLDGVADHPADLVDRLVAICREWSRTGRRDAEMDQEVRSMAAVLRDMGRK